MLIKKLTLTFVATLLTTVSVHAQMSNLNTYDYIDIDENIVVRNANVDDVFAIADQISLTAPILGSAHLIGTNVDISDDINQSVYVVGEQVNVRGFISQGLYALANNLTLNQTLGGDLRIAARNANINGNVQGRIMSMIEDVYIDSVIEGDVLLAAEHISFGPNAKIKGFITLYLPDDHTVEIPPYVADAQNVEIIVLADEHNEYNRHDSLYAPRIWHWIISPIIQVLILALLALVLAKVASGWTQKAYDRSQDGWARTSLRGVLSLIVLTGIAVLSLVTIIGIPITLVAILAMVIAVWFGWIMCTYLCGNMVMNRLGKDPKNSLSQLALSCLIGAALITLVTLIPWIGWLFAIGITIYGVGCLTPYVLRLDKE